MNNTLSTPSLRAEVIGLTPVDAGNLKAFADVKVGEITLHKCRLIQQQGQRAYVAAPQAEWTNKDGQRRFTPFVTWPKSWGESITAAVVAECDRRYPGRLSDPRASDHGTNARNNYYDDRERTQGGRGF